MEMRLMVFPKVGVVNMLRIREIEGISRKGKIKILELEHIFSKTKILVDIEKISVLRIRPLSSLGEVKEAEKIINEPVIFVNPNPTFRSSMLQAKLTSGRISDIAEIIRDVNFLEKENNATSEDKRLASLAKTFFDQETRAVEIKNNEKT